MDDNLKAALKALRGAAGGSLDRGVVDAILAHIDGEPSRLAAKAEEVREACAEAIYRANPVAGACVEICRATPLDATPLADRLAAAKARVAENDKRAEEVNDAHLKRVAMLWGARDEALERAKATEARVAELERALADAVAIAREFDARQQKAEAERDEAVAALRDAPFRGRHAVDMVHDPCRCSQCLWVDRRAAVLAKYPEGK